MIHYMIRWLSMAWGAFLPHLKEGDSCGGPVEKLPPVKSAVQEAVSSLTDKSMGARQAEIKRTATKNR